VPHWPADVPASQIAPLQQPLPHRLESHAAVHCWLSQCCAAEHATHVMPSVPHAASVLPAMQVVPLQQPPGHKLASHAATHCWLSQ
jgi:hypothetical protein